VRFIHVPTFLIVAGFAFVGIWTCFGSSVPWRAVKSSLGLSAALDEASADLYLSVFKRGYQLTWTGCVLGIAIGTMYMIQNADEGAMWLVSSTIPMALLHVLYATIVAEVGFRNLSQWMHNRMAIATAAVGEANQQAEVVESKTVGDAGAYGRSLRRSA